MAAYQEGDDVYHAIIEDTHGHQRDSEVAPEDVLYTDGDEIAGVVDNGAEPGDVLIDVQEDIPL